MNDDTPENDDFDSESQPSDGFDFKGEEQTYDDGLFWISLPSELVAEDGEDCLIFRIESLPFEVVWFTDVFTPEELAEGEIPAETLEEAIRSFMPEFPPDKELGAVPLANGLNLVSHAWREDGQCHACCMLGEFLEDGSLVIAMMAATAPLEWENDFRYLLLLHMLRTRIRFAEFTLGEPPVSCSPEYLYVPKIAVQFPEELGPMRYEFFTDYEADREGDGAGLKYADRDGRVADIFVYDLGNDLIEPGPETEQVLALMEQVLAEIEAYYHPIPPKVVGESLSTYGRHEIPFLDRRLLLPGFEGTVGTVSAVLLTSFRGAYVKIRFTPLPGECEVRHPVLESFMGDLADVLGC